MKKYILSIDAGTTGVTIILLDKNLRIAHRDYSELIQYYPNPGWVEHNPIELIHKINQMLNVLFKTFNPNTIDSIGITNQRETTVVWDKISGKPVYNAIVWQCRRTNSICENLKEKYNKTIFDKTGLYIDSYFSASKIKWILDNVDYNKSNILFGTIDTWIIWNLTNKKEYSTDFTNASRTMLYNINTKKWDPELLNLFNIPKSILPRVKKSMDDFGFLNHTNILIPIKGLAGDQQAALFGQNCLTNGSSKCTYGTGLFFLLNIGKNRKDSSNGLLTTLAVDKNGNSVYAIEGSVFIGGAVIQWLRDELNLINEADESDEIAKSIDNTNGVYIVPAFVGLGAPYWKGSCRGTITGLTRGSNKNHIIRASLESIAYQVNDLINCIVKDFKKPIENLKVDGGATKNDFLLQFQADICNLKVIKPTNIESTALGAGILAGISNKFWKSSNEAFSKINIEKTYYPKIDTKNRIFLLKGWQNAIQKTID